MKSCLNCWHLNICICDLKYCCANDCMIFDVIGEADACDDYREVKRKSSPSILDNSNT